MRNLASIMAASASSLFGDRNATVTETPPQLAPVAWAWLLGIAALRLFVHLLSNGQYGFHRDELELWSDAHELVWGYVAWPPLTPALAKLGMAMGGGGLVGFRLFASLTQVAATVLCALMARELGGRRLAQVLAALAFTAMPFSMVQGSVLMYSGIDLGWWTLLVWMLLKLCNSGDGRWWLAIGVGIGLSLLTRYTALVWSLALVAAVLATPVRRHFATRWPWLGALLTLVVISPHAWWQWQHNLIALDFTQHIHARDIAMGRTDNFFPNQIGLGGPTLAPLWLLGLGWLLLARGSARWRALGWFYLVALVGMALSHARDYYMAPGYPPLYAAGAVAWELGMGRLQGARRISYVAVTAVLMAITLAFNVVIMLPVWPIKSAAWNASRKVHDIFAEEIGWPELVAATALVYHGLPESERAVTGIYTNNYGEAGAIERYGPALGLPTPISAINSYWYRGYGAVPPQTVIILGADAENIASTPADCKVAGRVSIPFGVENEESTHPDIYVCRHLRFDWARAWPTLRHFG